MWSVSGWTNGWSALRNVGGSRPEVDGADSPLQVFQGANLRLQVVNEVVALWPQLQRMRNFDKLFGDSSFCRWTKPTMAGSR
jgi:hypothetical protein